MARSPLAALAQLISEQETTILNDWLQLLTAAGSLESGRIREAELRTQCGTFLKLFRVALTDGDTDTNSAIYSGVRDNLGEISRSRATQGFSPRETASFIFSLKEPLFSAINRSGKFGAAEVTQFIRQLTLALDDLGLFTMEVYQKSREQVIIRQQREISELSTPVVKLWDGILALPLIGTLDSERTQVVMENLLQTIVDQAAEIAIIDITGVPTVDTLTAQHLLKTVAAARLMGADCIVSGIRPQIAQTMVHLGVELNVISKATLADAFAVALKRMSKAVVTVKTVAQSS
jgi:rsbT co-antagonist protein RsbR